MLCRKAQEKKKTKEKDGRWPKLAKRGEKGRDGGKRCIRLHVAKKIGFGLALKSS